MREETGCKIMISDAIPQVHERILTAIGPADMVAKAYCLIAGQLEKVFLIER
jgi:poly(rC)-binding protein 2/3/4